MTIELFDFKTAKEKFILERLAQGMKPKEIIDGYNALKRGDTISSRVVNYYRTRRSELISRMRDTVVMNSMDIPIANERVRLQRAEELYSQAQGIMGVKDKVETSLKCLDFAREETQTDTPQNLNVQFNQFNELTNEQLLEKKKELERKILGFQKDEVIHAEAVN